jgi:cytochrome b561
VTISRRLHWWSAGLVLCGFSLGWLMVAIPFSALLLKFMLYQLHKTIGLIVFGLTSVRIVIRRRQGVPPGLVQAVLYGLLLAVPVLGYLTAAFSMTGVPTLFLGFVPVPHLVSPNAAWSAVVTPVHRALAIALILAAGWHAATSARWIRRVRRG